MDAGKRFFFGDLDVGVWSSSFSASMESGEDIGASVTAISRYAPDLVDFDIGIEASVVYSHVAATGVTTRLCSLSIPALSVMETDSAEAASGSSFVRFLGFAVYVEDTATWLATWTGIEWWANGSVAWSDGAGTLAGGYLAPAGIPLIGGPPKVSAGTTGIAPPLPISAIDLAFSDVCTVSGSGGWRFDPGSGSVSLPIELDVASVPGHGGACGCDPDMPSFGGTTTSDIAVEAEYRLESVLTPDELWECEDCPNGPAVVPLVAETHDATTTLRVTTTSVTALPALTREIVRLGGADSFALWYRFGFPRTQLYASAACHTDFDPTPESQTVDVSDVHPRRSEFLGGVGESVHAIEDPLADVACAPYEFRAEHWTVTETFVTVLDVGSCPPDPPGPPPQVIDCWPVNDELCGVVWTAQFPYAVDDRTDNPDIAPLYDHLDALARYYNTVCAPHWSFVLWFPPDVEEGGILSYEWPVDGARANPSEYWEPIRTQYCMHPALPAPENVLRRTSIVAEPLMSGGLVEWLRDNLFGQLTSWVGVACFDLLGYTVPSSYTYDDTSAALWSGEDCSVTPGASTVNVDPDAGITDVKVRLDLSSFSEGPRLFAQLCDRISFDWAATNVAAMSVYLENPHGDKVLLGTAPGTQAVRPLSNDSKYAGTWAQDKGNGLVTDTGSDSQPEGESAAVCGSAERVHAFELLRGRGAKWLLFELTVDDPDVDVEIEYPTVHSPADPAKVVAENGSHHAVVFADGPGLRTGQWSFWNGSALLETPVVYPIGWPKGQGWLQSALDALVAKRVLMEAREYDDGLDAEQQSVYDAVENAGTTADERYERTDEHTHCFPVESEEPLGTHVLVNSFREVPPASMLPVYDRGADLVQTTGLVQKAWTFSKRRRSLVYAGARPRLVDPDTLSDWYTHTAVCAGWHDASHDRAVDNEEVDFSLRVDGVELALIRPWHGDFAVFPDGSLRCLSYDVSPSNRHVRVSVDGSDELQTQASSNLRTSLAWSDPLPGGFDAADATVRFIGSTGVLGLLYATPGGDVEWRTSPDEGENWSGADSVGSGTRTAWRLGRNQERHQYWLDGDAIKGRIVDQAGNVLVSTFTVVASGVDDAPIACDEDFRSGGAQNVLLRYFDGGTLTEVRLKDGQATTGSPVTFGDGTQQAWVTGRANQRIGYKVESDAIKGSVYDAGDGALIGTFTAVASGVEDSGIAVDESFVDGGVWRVVLFYHSAGLLVERHSYDAVNFA